MSKTLLVAAVLPWRLDQSAQQFWSARRAGRQEAVLVAGRAAAVSKSKGRRLQNLLPR